MFAGLPTAFVLFKNANHKYSNDQQSVLMRTMHDLHTNNIRAIDVDAITDLLNQRQQSEDSMDTRARKAMLLLAASNMNDTPTMTCGTIGHNEKYHAKIMRALHLTPQDLPAAIMRIPVRLAQVKSGVTYEQVTDFTYNTTTGENSKEKMDANGHQVQYIHYVMKTKIHQEVETLHGYQLNGKNPIILDPSNATVVDVPTAEEQVEVLLEESEGLEALGTNQEAVVKEKRLEDEKNALIELFAWMMDSNLVESDDNEDMVNAEDYTEYLQGIKEENDRLSKKLNEKYKEYVQRQGTKPFNGDRKKQTLQRTKQKKAKKTKTSKKSNRPKRPKRPKQSKQSKQSKRSKRSKRSNLHNIRDTLKTMHDLHEITNNKYHQPVLSDAETLTLLNNP